MVEETKNENFAPKKEQFEFILSINGNIICQRYFRINGYKREAYSSIDLIHTLDDCVNLIDNDLRQKTEMYYEMTAPQVLNSKDDLEAWCNMHRGERFIRPTYIIFNDSEDVYVWDGNVVNVYEKNFNRADYLSDKENDTPCTLKFSFRDNGREVCSKTWDGNVYPRFIRTNIDISNSKNKYRNSEVFLPVERFVIDAFNEAQDDLIPTLVKNLCTVCSYENADDYTSTVNYGGKEYDLSIRRANNRYFRTLENKYRKKTNDYFRGH